MFLAFHFSRVRGVISLSLLFPTPLQSKQIHLGAESKKLQTIFKTFMLTWLSSVFLQDGTWEFKPFYICDPSHPNKVFGQLKQDHEHTLSFRPFVPSHQSVSLFVCLFCVPANWQNLKPFVSVCAFMDVLIFLPCFFLWHWGAFAFL